MKILFAGAGALGLRFAYMMHKAGHDIVAIDGWKDHVDAMKKNGLQAIIDGKDEGYLHFPVYHTSEVNQIKDNFELVFVATKAMGLKDMLKTIQPLMNPKTKIICVLNGLGHITTLKQFIAPENILIGTTVWSSGLGGPGVLKTGGSGKMDLKQVEEKNLDYTMQIVEELNKAGLNVNYSQNVYASIWNKAVVNCVLNTMCTLIDCNINEYGSYEHNYEISKAIIDEMALVAKAEDNVDMDKELVHKIVAGTFPIDKQGLHYPSLYQDMKNKRLTEIDYLNGAVARMGKAHNIPTPINAFIAHLIHSKENKNGNK
ncbi:2-dehydropantoate 2-reductase [Mycoplasma sp. ES3157-GEN-MYC]|uniref:2-dehydropantoate 2-reductase n=1 Tax=Mycoplasma miroungigenitalium TaxID=754515 RepID=A0A6M4J8K7_9MOLU|nr:2-dehydropantoate 2-reductase [Mycoplasma miroungigenitalium]MBU4690152.1 2-dehydropantoate 2-reductase [Mycoplasma miroungigenitalium]MBU4691425.1 2-dehydropantoate 2-reductase [Mycoplasma miroungigenitalium]QJR43260.1 2-dehydropantoate 2-reductase [Mycoplasma miroungigenitalium]